MNPNLIILGAQKAGTTSLHNWLSQHPDIYSIPELKDKDFYSHPERRQNPEQHFSPYFKQYNQEKYILHTHVNYLIYKQAISNIKKFSPDAKLIAVLRPPVDRAVSAYNYFLKLRREKRPLDEALNYTPQTIEDFSYHNNDFTYLEHGYYSKQLDELKKHFSNDQFLILDFAEMVTDRSKFMDRVFRFIDIPPSDAIDYQAKNITGVVKNDAVQEVLSSGKGASFVRKILQTLTTPEMRRKMKERLTELNTSNEEVKPVKIQDDLREKLEQLFHADVKHLAEVHSFDQARSWPEFKAATERKEK